MSGGLSAVSTSVTTGAPSAGRSLKGLRLGCAIHWNSCGRWGSTLRWRGCPAVARTARCGSGSSPPSSGCRWSGPANSEGAAFGAALLGGIAAGVLRRRHGRGVEMRARDRPGRARRGMGGSLRRALPALSRPVPGAAGALRRRRMNDLLRCHLFAGGRLRASHVRAVRRTSADLVAEFIRRVHVAY